MNVQRFQTPEAGEVVSIKLECSDFDGEVAFRFVNRCSEGCNNIKLFVTPRLRGSTISAYVCSGRYEFVTSLSKEWWARRAASVLGWDESKIREQTDEVWARKVHNANIAGSFKLGQSKRKTGAACLICAEPVAKGVELCSKCLSGDSVSTADTGSLDELDDM